MIDQDRSEEFQPFILDLLRKATRPLVVFLESTLPQLFNDWWSEAVVPKLTEAQQRRVSQNNLSSLGSLDLAALLRVFDQNWWSISNHLDLTYEARHHIKGMQIVRNRWAHMGAEGLSEEAIYRDVDTLQQFLDTIDADESLVTEVKDVKSSIFGRNKPMTPQPETEGKEDVKTADAQLEFKPAQIVYQKANPDLKGAVVEAIPGDPENRYKVFIDNKLQTFYASQLKLDQSDSGEIQRINCEQFHSYLTALQIGNPSLSTLYSLNAARIDFIPYQFRPVLRFIRSDRPRLLIADGVGVGKTIEAGLILRELQARRDVNSVLIICPRPLVTERKWELEMKRFDERFVHLNGDTLRYCINEMDLEGVWPEQHQKAILPYSLFDEALLYGTGARSKRKWKRGLLDLDPPPRFDLVIVDEAHHIRNQDTYAHKAVRFFCDHAEAVVFLTATPIQLGNEDLFVLLNTLRPDLIIDRESFSHMTGPNPNINQAIFHARSQEAEWMNRAVEALELASSTAWGKAILSNNPDFRRIKSRLETGSISADERINVITELESLHTLSGIINRTQRRDIGEFTVRKPETVEVEFTPEQMQLHEKILQTQFEVFNQLHGNKSVGFMMTTIRRQAASSLFGLIPFLEEILNRHVDELSWSESDSSDEIIDTGALSRIEERIKDVLEHARGLDPVDPKLTALKKIIRDKQALPNNKVMLFSSFRHTLHYLFKHLSQEGFRVGLVHGGTPDEDRVEMRRRFEGDKDKEETLDIMLFSEIGCEGLDYQFCDCIVNYDLPWNPMRIEQRIGRIDRQGQQSESIVIYNLITPGTVDADIYVRCLSRIGVFNNALGGSEEILGEITQEIRNIAESYELNEDERQLKLQQLADNKIRLIQEQEQLEKKQLELFGIRLPEDQMLKEIGDASSYWLSPESMKRLVNEYLQEKCGGDHEYILGEKALKTLRLSQEARASLLVDFQKLRRKKVSMYREWENWLKGNEQHLTITFDQKCASQNQKAAFLMPLHPLIRQAANELELTKRPIVFLKATSGIVPEGEYKFAIYSWHFSGLREDLVLKPIASSDIVTEHLSEFLTAASNHEEANSETSPDWEIIDGNHYQLWSDARSEHLRRTEELTEFKRESLSNSHQARIALLKEQLNQASDEKIKRMRQSQIDTAESDYARRLQELNISIERADIKADPVAYGFLYITKE